jgi:predicted GIY-YIG superfamily endonuclease
MSEAVAAVAAVTRWHVYLLLNDAKTRSYVGATVDPNRRLRQHNRELKGGACATSGDHWTRVCLVRGFPDERAALQFEWMWKHLTRKLRSGAVLDRRYKALNMMQQLGRSSSTSVPFSNWLTPLHIEKVDEQVPAIEQMPAAKQLPAVKQITPAPNQNPTVNFFNKN